MFSFTEFVTVKASPKLIWAHLIKLERWWVASNPDHIRLEILSADNIVAIGTQIDFEERIAGVKAVASGKVVSLYAEAEAVWEGTALYHHMGFRLPVDERVVWHIEGMGDVSLVSAGVWAEFPSSLKGRFCEWYATKILNVVERTREHTRRELNYLKGLVEAD